MLKKSLIFVILVLIVNIYGVENFQIEEDVKSINEKLFSLKTDLKKNLEHVSVLYSQNADEQEFEKLLIEVKKIRQNIHQIEEKFRKESINDAMKNDEGYAFWDQGESSISQLIMEYGSQDHLYVIPSELSSMKINLFSTIPIPRQSWEDMLQLILTHNGIGIKKLNPFLRQLYVLKHDPSHIDAIVNRIEDLNYLEDGSLVCFIFSPNPEQLRNVQSFLERFSDLKQTTVHAIQTNIVVIGSKETLTRLINLYDAVFKNSQGKIVTVISLTKIATNEAEKILQAFFMQTQKTRPAFYQGAIDELSVVAQGSSIILIGEAKLVQRAEKVLFDLERQLDDPSEMSIYWYTCKHSDPQDLADVLEKIYLSMSGAKIEEKSHHPSDKNIQGELKGTSEPNLPVQPKFIQPGSIISMSQQKQLNSNNFVVDPKTGSILMVVRKDELPKLKAIIKKLDEPKKMVQIDVLLVERKFQDRKQTGINLLKIGATKTPHQSTISFDAGTSSKRKGILDFILSRPKGKLPAFDLALSFLMAQDDMRIADCPSILAINQTPATISVVDEISINNGAIQIDTSSGPKLEKSFTRAQFGTTIVLTPTIHLSEEEFSKGFVTLHTDVSFDTTKSKDNDKPTVTRRHIENEVRVADGETIILGGLRRKTGEEGSEKIPFLGEIPGIGKLFGTTRQAASSSEMFIFITPHIIKDPLLDLETQRKQSLQRRQGDIDEFVAKLQEAKDEEKKKLFENSIKLFFDK